ncbi:hypothetical protein A5734_01745 [Mycolicibacterium fortuitum]|nr:hypothetical protein A5734_01745 [Mycolicibacterium fortuitum]
MSFVDELVDRGGGSDGVAGLGAGVAVGGQDAEFGVDHLDGSHDGWTLAVAGRFPRFAARQSRSAGASVWSLQWM